MDSSLRVGIVAGEASGDLLGAGLAREIRTRFPEAHFEGVVGPAMRAEACEELADSVRLAVMGLIEPLKVLPDLLRLRRYLLEHWIANPPDVFVGIDAPEFNLGLELRLRQAGIPTVQYVSPQVWAWRRRRVRKIGRAVDRVLCLLPFEKAFYDEHGVDAVVVGHPLADQLPRDADRIAERRELGIGDVRVVTLMPGSRLGEVRRLGPVFARAAEMLAQRDESITFVAPMASTEARHLFGEQLEKFAPQLDVTLLDGESTRAIIVADVVLLASGTASLQTALLQRPMVSAYKVTPATYWLARALRLLKVPHFTMPNLLTREPLVPEYLQQEATPEQLAEAVGDLLHDAERRQRIEAAFGELRETLALNADQRAADAVIEVARAGAERD